MKTKPPATDAEIADLDAAMAAFEAGLPAKIGLSGAWPELTDVRREQLREIHRLFTIVDERQRPRRACMGCSGRGWFFVDPDDVPDWRPCRRCLTTGLQLELSTGGNTP
ncbi:hypothetical protein ACFCV3_41555 [Kribbella sp. NPDC056345]|uniref:hypothetical protein n=1 Tax=Kribbella sp. NPDC056345 TaxID=3345789 RepID=UPI0035D7A203